MQKGLIYYVQPPKASWGWLEQEYKRLGIKVNFKGVSSMTSKEFEKKIKELGYKYVCDTSEVEEGIVVEYARDENGHTLLCTDNNYPYNIDTAWFAFEQLPKAEKDKLFYVFYQYIKTDIKDRGLSIEKHDKTVTEYKLNRQ
ncbi:hypothetical protein Alsa2_CDS0112 [Staphylococcus phage Alsa_2]|nr:hypothetical protein Alsa2_CDS0112 [Staphylococcus phage Alsa_2]